jgi:hypothetical protein
LGQIVYSTRPLKHLCYVLIRIYLGRPLLVFWGCVRLNSFPICVGLVSVQPATRPTASRPAYTRRAPLLCARPPQPRFSPSFSARLTPPRAVHRRELRTAAAHCQGPRAPGPRAARSCAPQLGCYEVRLRGQQGEFISANSLAAAIRML